MKKRGQVTIFVILALVIVVSGVLIFVFKDSISGEKVPAQIDPIYNSMTSCIEGITISGISILQSTGGHIYLPEFEAGSRYAPFSSRLDFVGVDIPYWFYMSASGLKEERIPELNDLEKDLENYISERVLNCDLSSYKEEGFTFVESSPTTKVRIKNNVVDVEVRMDLSIKRGEEIYLLSLFESRTDSELGNLYYDAAQIYSRQNEELFLEEYSVDVLNNYAPVDGIEFSCSPISWSAPEVFSELGEAFSNNLASISNNKDSQDYFYLDSSVESEVRFLTSPNWPSYYGVAPSEEALMLAEPVGREQGLGIAGLCYTPYHFVYDIRYPVLIQLFKNGETFQFPMVVLIEGNLARESASGISSEALEVENFCEDSSTEIKINVYDSDSNELDANLAYTCLNSKCDLGKAQEGYLETLVPQCLNGKLVASLEGYRDFEITHSSVNESSINLILDKVYEKEIKINLEGSQGFDSALITFDNGEEVQTVIYPQQNSVSLSNGIYEVEALVYANSNLELESFTREQCVEVESGIKGFFGVISEECFDVEFPNTIVSSALFGGGRGEVYFSDSELTSSSYLEINSENLKVPENLEDLQNNYVLFELLELEVSLE